MLMTIREAAAMMRGLVLADGQVRLGFVASSAESARLTGLAMAELLKRSGATWHTASREIQWPSGASVTFHSGKDPDQMRGRRWRAAFCSVDLATHKELQDALFLCVWRGRGSGTVLTCAEVQSREELAEMFRAERAGEGL